MNKITGYCVRRLKIKHGRKKVHNRLTPKIITTITLAMIHVFCGASLLRTVTLFLIVTSLRLA